MNEAVPTPANGDSSKTQRRTPFCTGERHHHLREVGTNTPTLAMHPTQVGHYIPRLPDGATVIDIRDYPFRVPEIEECAVWLRMPSNIQLMARAVRRAIALRGSLVERIFFRFDTGEVSPNLPPRPDIDETLLQYLARLNEANLSDQIAPPAAVVTLNPRERSNPWTVVCTHRRKLHKAPAVRNLLHTPSGSGLVARGEETNTNPSHWLGSTPKQNPTEPIPIARDLRRNKRSHEERQRAYRKEQRTNSPSVKPDKRRRRKQLNGSNGSYTNTDDHAMPGDRFFDFSLNWREVAYALPAALAAAARTPPRFNRLTLTDEAGRNVISASPHDREPNPVEAAARGFKEGWHGNISVNTDPMRMPRLYPISRAKGAVLAWWNREPEGVDQMIKDRVKRVALRNQEISDLEHDMWCMHPDRLRMYLTERFENEPNLAYLHAAIVDIDPRQLSFTEVLTKTTRTLNRSGRAANPDLFIERVVETTEETYTRGNTKETMTKARLEVVDKVDDEEVVDLHPRVMKAAKAEKPERKRKAGKSAKLVAAAMKAEEDIQPDDSPKPTAAPCKHTITTNHTNERTNDNDDTRRGKTSDEKCRSVRREYILDTCRVERDLTSLLTPPDSLNIAPMCKPFRA